MWFTERLIIEKFCEGEHLLPPDTYVALETNYHWRIRISFENLLIELSDKDVKTFLSQPLLKEHCTQELNIINTL